jgi:hypothetical protein
VRKSELEIVMSVHNILMSSQLLISNNRGLNDLDRTITGTVSTSHLLIALLDSTKKSSITVLLVHIVGTRTRVVSEPDTIVLDFGVLLMDLRKSTKTS